MEMMRPGDENEVTDVSVSFMQAQTSGISWQLNGTL